MITAHRVISCTTAGAVAGVAGQWWQPLSAYDLVRAHRGGGLDGAAGAAGSGRSDLRQLDGDARLGSARHVGRLPVPALARWLLGEEIAATLAANLAHGLLHV